MSKDRIPHTDSIRELASFWDTHDLTDLEAQLDEVTEKVFERGSVVKVNLLDEEARAVQRLAESRGTDSAALIRQWVLDRLQAS
jgi:hypothetical protein